jgi:uncharacterized protein
MQKRVIVIHGYGSTPDQGWRPWLRWQLEERGMEVRMPAMPEPQHPRKDAWVRAIRESVATPDRDCVLVGHSLGCIAILRYLESLKEGEHVGRVVLLAGFYEDLGDGYDELRSFLDTPVDWRAIRSHCDDFHVIHSDDDESVPVPCGQALAEKLGVPLELHHGYGHFGSASGIMELPLVLEKIA